MSLFNFSFHFDLVGKLIASHPSEVPMQGLVASGSYLKKFQAHPSLDLPGFSVSSWKTV